MVDMVKSGQLPLWNPYVFCGYPLLGTLQIGLFYPLSVIHYILPFNLAFNYYTILHYFLASLFMYWLTRHFKLSRPSAFLSAVVFAFSGYLLSMANMNTTLSSVIWTPLILLFYDRHIQAQKFFSRDLIILGILLAMQFLGGEPTIIYLTSLFLLVYGLVESQKSINFALRNMGGLALGLVMAGGLTAMQLFPFLETALLSLRAVATDYAFISFKAFPPRELINLVLPFFFGNLLKEGNCMPILSGDQFQAWIISPYMGIFPLLFALLSIRKGIDRKVVLFWGAVIFSFFLAFARFTPVYAFFFKFLPGISFIRYPVKYIFLAAFFLPVLCGFGFERVQELIEKSKSSFNGIIIFLSLLLVLVGSAYLWASANLQNIFHYLKRFYPLYLEPYYVEELWNILTFNIRSLGILFIFLLLGLLLVFLFKKGILAKGVFGFLMVSLIIFDLFSSNFSINQPAAFLIFEQDTPNVQIIKKDEGLFRYFSIPTRMVDLGARGGTYGENLFQDKDNLSPNWLVPYRIANLGGRESMEPREFMKLYWKNAGGLAEDHGKLMDLANVKYVFASEDIRDLNLLLLRKKKVGDLFGYLYKNLDYYPRAFFIKSVRAIKNRDEIVDELLEGGIDLKREVILEEDVDYRWQPASKKEKVEIIQYEPNRVLIATFSDKPRILFLSDTYYPGWKAYVDGKETRIYRANYMFRAVYLGSGQHRVEFIYAPMSFKLGSLISLITIALVALISFKIKT